MAFITLASAGCKPAANTSGTLQLSAQPAWEDDRVMIESAIDFQPSLEMAEALARGVDLGLRLEIRARRRFGPLHLTRVRVDHLITLSFLPLTEQWQITTEQRSEQFPRRWLMLEALNEPRRWAVAGLDRAGIAQGDWQLQARVRIDLDTLPPAMHLPALFSTQWRLASQEHSWQLRDS